MPEPVEAPDNPRRRRGILWGLLAVLVLAVAGLLTWKALHREPGRTLDREAAAAANARGLGYMEQFEEMQEGGKRGYDRAAECFEEAARLAPDWTPARINLGIALLNMRGKEDLERAIRLFEDVLKTEPDNPYAHFNLGLIYEHQARLADAHRHFTAVTRIDPADPYAWYYRGVTHPDRDSAESKEFFRKALDLNPNFNSARHALIVHPHEHDAAKSGELLDTHRRLRDANWEETAGLVYTEKGKYGLCIGLSPAPAPAVGPVPAFEKDERFVVKLAEGTRWAKPIEIGPEPVGRLPETVRLRFGATIVRLDYDRDGRPDLLLLAAVIRNGQLTDVLLHNDGNGRFTDVSASAGLLATFSFGAAVGDFDNDGWPDVALTGRTGVRLLRNVGGKQFADRTAEAGLDKLTGVFLGSAWIDLDQDGDLDLLLARYADDPEVALDLMDGKRRQGGGVVVVLNVGEAPPAIPTEPPPALTCRFQPTDLPSLSVRGAVTGFVCSDLDSDEDVDVIVLADGEAPAEILNDRLLRFRSGKSAGTTSKTWTGGLSLDSDADERSERVLLRLRETPIINNGSSDFPPLLQSQTFDVNLDGRADVLGLSSDRKPVLLLGDGPGKFSHKPGAFGPAETVENLVAVSSLDYDSDGNPDLLLWSEGAGLVAFRNKGVGNRGVRIELTGRRDKGASLRTNADGVGARVTVHAGSLRTSIENTTLQAGLGQSRLPLEFGIGKAQSAETVRIRWPDGVPQAELNLPAGQLTKIVETNRKGGSCPILLTWDGTRFRYITDFLGGGAVGEMQPDGSTRPPRPEESVKIEPGQLVPRDGRYVLKLAEPMDELMYLDHLRLEVIDHPAGVEVHPDERFATGGPAPTQQLLAFRERHFARAVDHRGRNVTDALRTRDGQTVAGFRHRPWLGFAEEHFVELDFASVPPGNRHLVLAGWIDYPYPESIFAAVQAGVPMLPPVLERLNQGKWEKVADHGFPAGLPKVMTYPLSELAGAKDLRLRIRTNLQMYWDQVYLAAAEPASAVTLPVAKATLEHRGFMKEVWKGPTHPVEYDDAHTERVAVTRWQGRLTRTGDVTPLLTALDDRFVLNGPGDETTVEFDATSLPPVKPGHVRSFVLRTFGYCKDTAPFTATGGHVGPLPFRAMTSYPEGARTPPPDLEAYVRDWNTRPAGRPR
jgi:tetratricopeptide (TPR) repeat protein